MILSVFWKGMTSRGAVVAMVVGFACVPFFKIIAPEFPVVGPFFAALEELPPAFILSALAGVTVASSTRRGGSESRGRPRSSKRPPTPGPEGQSGPSTTIDVLDAASKSISARTMGAKS